MTEIIMYGTELLVAYKHRHQTKHKVTGCCLLLKIYR